MTHIDHNPKNGKSKLNKILMALLISANLLAGYAIYREHVTRRALDRVVKTMIDNYIEIEKIKLQVNYLTKSL